MPRPVGPLRQLARRFESAAHAPERWAYQKGYLDATRLRLPDFLGIGVQKGGSSWLWENLRRHPELYLPEQKELHFFDRRWHRSLRAYARYFRAAGSRLAGEITPAYGDMPADRIRYLHALRPRLRLIVLLRDPVDRAWSHARMHLLEKSGRRRAVEEVSAEEWRTHFQGPDSRSKGNYRAILENWEGVFGPEQLFVGFFEDISTRPIALLSEVFGFLGASIPDDWSPYPASRVVNPGREVPLPADLRRELVELYRPQLAWLRDRFGDRVAHWGE